MKTIIEFFKSFWALFNPPGQERPSPQDWLSETALAYDQSTGILSVNLMKLNVKLSAPPTVILPGIPNTNSMDPVFDEGHTNILMQGANSPDMDALRNALKIGDVAVYMTADGGSIIHRIVGDGTDAEGKYFVFAGDNNSGIRDAQIVRLENIAYVSLGAIY